MGILAVRLILEEPKIWNLHETSVQSFVGSFIIMTSVEPTAPTFSQFFLYLRLWWKYNFYKGSHYKHKETSLRKVLEVNPLRESCLYEVAEAAFSPNVLHTHIWNPSNFCFVLFWCFFFNYTEIEKLRVNIKSYHGMKVKLKLFMHKEHYHSIDYSIFIVKLC